MNNTRNEKIDSLESKIGLYWMHKLGIVTLVLGIVFLITYSIQQCANPLLMTIFRLSTGVAVSAFLLFLGNKMSKREGQKWYAHGLTAGGWSLAYFTTYAAYYIPDVKLIPSLPIETFLLSAVAGGSLWSALKARSEPMAIYSFCLAAAAIIMNGPGLASNTSFLIIAIAASILGNAQAWRKLFAFSMAACYLGFFACSILHGVTGDGAVSLVFLSLLWLTFGTGIGYSIRIPDGAKSFFIALACVNALLFASGLTVLKGSLVAFVPELVFLAAGLVYLATSRWLSVRKEEQLNVVHSLLGLFFVNAAKCMYFGGLSLMAIDVIQIALLAFVGLRFKIKAFSWVAVLLSVLFFPIWLIVSVDHLAAIAIGFKAAECVRIGLLFASVLCALAYIHIKNDESSPYSFFYYLAGNFMWFLALLYMVEQSWQTLAFVLLATANLIFGVIRNKEAVSGPEDNQLMTPSQSYYSGVALIPFIVASVLALTNLNSWLSLPMTLVVVALFAGFGIARSVPRQSRNASLEESHWVFAYAATIVMTLLVFLNVPTTFVSLALGIEGIGLVLAGFLLRERFFRLSGLMILGTLTFKLLFVDLAHHNTIERILSFIAAGVTFLVSSYAYGKFTDSFMGKEAPVLPENEARPDEELPQPGF